MVSSYTRSGYYVSSDRVREGFHDLIERADEKGGVEPWLLQLLEETRELILEQEHFIEET
jgi:hypothetical protein